MNGLTVEHVLLGLPFGPQVQEVGSDEQAQHEGQQVTNRVVLREPPVRLGELPQQSLELDRPAARVNAVECERHTVLCGFGLLGNQLLGLPASDNEMGPGLEKELNPLYGRRGCLKSPSACLQSRKRLR